jgi:hypothetical protein
MMDSINTKEEMESVSPDTIKFHGTFKSIARMLIKYLPFGNANEEQYAPLLKGNARVFYEIIKEWQKFDKRQHRKDILSKPLLIGCSVYFFDSDFREVFDFMLWRIIQRQDELTFPHITLTRAPGHMAMRVTAPPPASASHRKSW